MSTVAKEKSKIYEALLSSPGMTDNCKIILHLSRKNILALVRIIENGFSENTDELINLLTKESKGELETVVQDCLGKSGLTDFYNNLKSL